MASMNEKVGFPKYFILKAFPYAPKHATYFLEHTDAMLGLLLKMSYFFQITWDLGFESM